MDNMEIFALHTARSNSERADAAQSQLKSILNRSVTEFSSAEITHIGSYAFYGCRSLASLDLPNLTNIGIYAFSGCESLTALDFPNLTSINQNGFRNCTSLGTLVLRASTACTLGSNGLMNTAIAGGSGYIYVPDSLVNTYKAASEWSTYASRIKPLSEYEEA